MNRAPDGHRAVSVVVCTRNRGALVVNAIRSILASVNVSLDVIVVDQSDADDTQRAVAGLGHDARVRYHRTDTVGASRARNLGLGLARHPIVLFADDDVTVPTTWADILSRTLEKVDDAAVCFCAVVPGPHDGALGFVPGHRVDRYVIVRSLWAKSIARGIGAGMGVRRDAVLEVGGFDEQLGPGAPMRSAEDRDIAVRALVRGWSVCQTPETFVVHHGFRTWREGRDLARRDWYGIGAAYAKQLKLLNLQIIPVIVHEVVYLGILYPVYRAALGDRRAGLRRLGYFLQGAVRGFRTPIDRSAAVYRPPPGSASCR